MTSGAGLLPHRRRTWDLTHLSTKYPWLRVDSETIEEFRSPFEWISPNDQAVNSPGGSSSDGGSSDDNAPRYSTKPRRRLHSLASSKGRERKLGPHKRRLPVNARRRDHAIAKREVGLRLVNLASSPRVTRSESEDAVSPLPLAVAAKASVELTLPPGVYADLHSLKQQQRQRQHAKRAVKKPPSILSLRLPVLHKPSKRPLEQEDLTHQIARISRQELAIQRRLHEQIELEKAKLPLTFLFERNLDQTYCRQKCIETITSIFAKLQHRMLFHAFHRWLTLRDAQRDVERREAAVESAQRKALAFFERLASDAYVGTLARAFQRWQLTARQLVEAEIHAAATKIQTLFHQRRARALLQDLKQASVDREYKRRVEIQRLLRFESYGTTMKWQTLRNGFNLLLLSLCAKRITLFFRRIRTHKRVERRVARRQAATTIQCQWRCRLARATRQRLWLAREIQRERERVASVHLQRRARGYVARQHAALRRVQLSLASVSAGVIQRAWHRHSAYQALARRFQQRRRLMEEERARLAELERIHAARRDEQRRHQLAVRIQRLVRGFLGRRQATRRWRARELERAVRRVQQNWRKSKGRYALHLRFIAQRERLDDRRNASALLVQCRFRMRKAKIQHDALRLERQRRRQSAVAIQRVARGRHARHEMASKRRATVAIQSVLRGKLARLERERLVHERELAEQQRYQAALKLQCAARGHHARRLTRQLRSEQRQMEQLLQQSAALIQKRARGIEARKVALLLKQAMAVVDQQQTRAYANSTQHKVEASPLLTFLTQQYLDKQQKVDNYSEGPRYSREQLQWIQWQINATRQQMVREDRAIVLLQRRYRGYATRVQSVVQQLQRQKQLALEEQMARNIQRVGHGFLTRRRVRKLRCKRRLEEIKDAYVRERRWKKQEREWQEQYQQEHLALQLQRLRTVETQLRDAKEGAEIAKWNAEAAAARKQELREQLEAKTLERALRGEPSDEHVDEEEVDCGGGGRNWAYVADADGNWYYYNATTGESAWEKPVGEPNPTREAETTSVESKNEERPSNDLSKQQVNAKEVEVSEPSAAVEPSKPAIAMPVDVVPDGFCCKCKAVQADKECLDCLLPDLSLAVLYCAPCFTLEHNLLAASGSKGAHDFKVLRPTQLPSQCQHSPCGSTTDGTATNAPASYYCAACPESRRFSCETCFPAHHQSAQSLQHVPSSLHFRAGALCCVECQCVLAMRQCVQCDEAFCASCFEELHGSSQTKQQHDFTALEMLKQDLISETDAHCADCEIRLCTKLCNLCGDGFCEVCYANNHCKGAKKQHTWIPWTSFASHGDWLEIRDETAGKLVFFNIETKESTHTKPFVLQSGEQRHRVMFQERENAMKSKALALESEILKLKEHIATVEQEKDQEIERLRRSRRGGPDDGEVQSTTDVKKKPSAKKGFISGVFGRRSGQAKKNKAGESIDKPLSPEELQRLALQRSVRQNSKELAFVHSRLTTREREAKESDGKRAVGSKHFEQTMVNEIVASK